jgi:hypothetical protein
MRTVTAITDTDAIRLFDDSSAGSHADGAILVLSGIESQLSVSVRCCSVLPEI